MANGITIQEAARVLGMSTHTLRYYEKEGLVDHVSRTEGGIRLYSPENLEFLLFLGRLRKTGMPIREIRKYTELVKLGRESLKDREQMLKDHRKSIESQIAVLNRNLEVIDLKLNLYAQGWVPEDGPNECSEQLLSKLREK